MAKVIKRKSTVINKTEAENSQLELFRIKEAKKQLEKREAELKERLTSYMERAIQPDSKGHFTFTTKGENGENIHLQRQARKKVQLNQERAQIMLRNLDLDHLIVIDSRIATETTTNQIIDVLQEHAPHLLEDYEFVDERGLEQAVVNEEISMEQFEEMCDIQVTYAMTYVKDSDIEKYK